MVNDFPEDLSFEVDPPIKLKSCDSFEYEAEMEIESFDIRQKKEIFLNHPFKILMYYLRMYPPDDSIWNIMDLCDFYFEMLDTYDRFGISFNKTDNLFPDNCLYVVENDNSKKESWELYFKSNYALLFNNNNDNYDKKTLLFNKVKKIDLNKYDKGEKPLSDWEKEKRKAIKEQHNIYLKVALMDPNVYNNEIFFEESINGILDDYNADIITYFYLMYTNDEDDEYFKKRYKKMIDMVRNIHDLIEENINDYLGIIENKSNNILFHNFPDFALFILNPGNEEFNKKLFNYKENFVLAKKDPNKAKELFLKELSIKRVNFL